MKKIIYLLFLTLFVFTSCNQEDETIDTTIKSKQDKVTLCHNGNIIDVNGNALKAHLKHGDIQLVDEDGDGWVEMENECVPGGDCDDMNPLVNPGMEEICGNGIDDDCDGEIDEDCRTYVPDDGFEYSLIQRGLDDVMDDYVLTSNINTVEELSLNGYLLFYIDDELISSNIDDLTGLEDFTSLKKLFMKTLGITSLDLSKNTALVDLELWALYGLRTIDLSKNTELTRLYLWEIYNLDFGEVSNGLDLTSKTNLTRVSFIECNFNILDFSQNINLTFLSFDMSGFSSLNLKNGNNMNLGFNFETRGVDFYNCIQVDDAAWSAANWYVSSGISFSEDCGY